MTVWAAAACVELAQRVGRRKVSEVFFPEKGGDSSYAKSLCATCPLVAPCLVASIEQHEEHGVWGGAGENHRRSLAAAWARREHDEPVPVEACSCGWCVVLRRHLRRLRGEVAPVVNRNGPGAEHGVPATYERGCRCLGCTRAKRDRGVGQRYRRPVKVKIPRSVSA